MPLKTRGSGKSEVMTRAAEKRENPGYSRIDRSWSKASAHGAPSHQRSTLSPMTATTCGWCGIVASMTWLSDKAVSYVEDDYSPGEVHAPFSCIHCKRISVGVSVDFSTPSSPGMGPMAESWWARRNDQIEWTPASVVGKVFPDVPDHIASAADEAYKCHSIGAYRAAIMLSRAVVEATAKDHGIKTGNLADKIDAMEAKRIVRDYTKDEAHELRHLGNDMAHGDMVEPTESIDSEAVLVVMSSILEEVYAGPARVAAMKARRTREKESPDSEKSTSAGMSAIDQPGSPY